MKIEEIMTKDPTTVMPDSTVRDAAQIMKREDVGIVPVVESESARKLIGVITDRDITIRCIAEGRAGDCRVRDVMSADNLATCRKDDDVKKAMDAMSREKVRRIPIVDDRGMLIGIVSQADVLRKVDDDDHAERTIEQISQPGGKHSQ